ncbi:heme transporter hrg1-B-like [Schistocerca cancellata]|uniref:heme transporter hrg1-B-like n=1 Tax=Schistocerca cancellata TaxID=274614 RepID=UPI002119904F|nr:heme transporter hrg1-B-like [Schistocerca cancellata]
MALSFKNIALLSFCLLATVACFAAFVVFLMNPYRNYEASVWGLFSGVCAALVLHLDYLHARGRLSLWHSIETLNRICDFGFVATVLGTAGFVWYIFLTLYYKTTVFPVGKSTIIPAVWTMMTVKWGAAIMVICTKYRKYLRSLELLRDDSQ